MKDDDRLTQYNFRMTAPEKKKLKEMADKSGRSVSAYIRAKLFGGEVATINAVEFLKGYTTQIYEMQKIGNNVNQLAHYANICIKGYIWIGERWKNTVLPSKLPTFRIMMFARLMLEMSGVMFVIEK